MLLSRCAVIGRPIEHSLSPLIHHAFAKQVGLSLTYEKIVGDDHRVEQQVMNFFTQRQGRGLNVTLPFKQRAFELSAVRTARCTLAKAANTLWYQEELVYADNTDGIGLIRDLSRYCSLNQANVLILGAGGAARGIIHPLLAMNPQKVVLASRRKEPLEGLQRDIPGISSTLWSDLVGSFDLIINATSAGVQGERLVLPMDVMRSAPFCYDLSYNLQGATPFVAYAQQHGCCAVDGLGMLVEQASESFYLWHGLKPDAQKLLEQLPRFN